MKAAPKCEDLVQRPFTARDSIELWLTEITELPAGKGKLQLQQ